MALASASSCPPSISPFPSSFSRLCRTQVDVSLVRFTHDTISRVFAHGHQRGQEVATLVDDLVAGRVSAHEDERPRDDDDGGDGNDGGCRGGGSGCRPSTSTGTSTR